jgi:hypothetical protein
MTAESTRQLTLVVEHLKALIPPNSLQGVKYLPCEVRAKFSVLKEVDNFIEQCIRFKILKDIEHDEKDASRYSASENLATSISQTFAMQENQLLKQQ